MDPNREVKFKIAGKTLPTVGILAVVQVSETEVQVRYPGKNVTLKGTTSSAVLARIEKAKEEASTDSA